jgi:hypothetical protein
MILHFPSQNVFGEIFLMKISAFLPMYYASLVSSDHFEDGFCLLNCLVVGTLLALLGPLELHYFIKLKDMDVEGDYSDFLE